jgi:tetratricopeptide (TPR) repeat protein
MWQEAVEDFVKAVELKPADSAIWLQTAVMLLEVRDFEGYERLCDNMLDHFDTKLSTADAARTAHVCLLSPPSDAILAEGTRMSLRALERGPRNTFAYLVEGLSELRQRHPTQAIQWCQKFLSNSEKPAWVRDAEAHLIIALAHSQLNQHGEARAELDMAFQLLNVSQRNFESGYGQWNQWLVCQPLRREAEEIILGDFVSDVVRGNQYAQRGQWNEAVRHFKKAFNSSNQGYSNWHRSYAALLLETGDIDSYQQLCPQMLEVFRQTDNSGDATQTAKVCLLDPSAEDFLDEAADMADLARELAEAESNERVGSWAKLATAIAALRRGDDVSVIKWCDKVLAKPLGGWSQEAQANLVMAMAHWRLEAHDRARDEYDQATQILKNHPPDFTAQVDNQWYNWLICQHLLREAEALIRPANSIQQ